MSVLSDRDLARLWPDSPHIGPASIDLHLGEELLAWPRWIRRDPRTDQAARWQAVPLRFLYLGEGDPDAPHAPAWVLESNTRYLTTTRERIAIPDDCAGQISARSSWGRDGLAVICGPAGFIDPGFVGVVVLELAVTGSELVLWPGASVAQLIVHRLESPCERPYQGKYQAQDGITPSRMHLEVSR